MAYLDNFRHADDVVSHLNGIVPTLTDPLLAAKYVGFVAVAAVTVYEMAIKDIFCDFADKKHVLMGTFVSTYFNRINGRIKLKAIQEDYLARFGDRYLKRFNKNLEARAKLYLVANRRDIKTSYNNLIVWRNDFAHQGKVKSTTTYKEAVQAYEDGKEVIHCLAQSMTR